MNKLHADCHIHALLDGYYWKAAIARHTQSPDVPALREMLRAYKDLGCTYLRDGGDRWGAGEAARTLAADYGITYRTPLAPLCKKGHYGSFIGEVWENLEEYTALVRQHRAQGADFIKIMVSGLMDFDRFGVLTEAGLSAGEIWELVHIAHSEGFSVMAHCNGARTAEAAAAAGVDSVEHGAYLDRAALEVMASQGTVWVPTLSTVGNLRGKGRFSEYAVEKILAHTSENVETFAAIGGLVAPGTDAGAWAVPHGSRTEEALLCACGVSEEMLSAGIQKIRQKF